MIPREPWGAACTIGMPARQRPPTSRRRSGIRGGGGRHRGRCPRQTRSPRQPREQACDDRYMASRETGGSRGDDPGPREGAFEATPADAPDRPGRLSNLGDGQARALRAKSCAGRPRGGDRQLPRGAGRNCGGRRRPTGVSQEFGRVLLARYALTGASTDRDAAIDAFRKASELGLAIAPAITLGTAQAWGAWAGEREAWAEAAEAYGDGLAAIDRLYRTQLLPGRQADLACRTPRASRPTAAYALARTGDVDRGSSSPSSGAGRACLTEAIQRDRADLATSRRCEPAAYAAYEQAAGQLRGLESAGARGRDRPARGVAPSRPADQARQARADLQAAIASPSSSCPGTPAFGQPSTFEEVAAAAEPGCPVVALVTTTAGSVALLVSRTRRHGGPELRGDLGAGADVAGAQRPADHGRATDR